MSHFTVLVIGDDVEESLAPYHEFECTGRDDGFVKDIDITERCRKEFTEATETVYVAPDGTASRSYEDQFYRDPTEEEAKEHGRMMGSGCGGGISWTSKDWGDGRGYRAKVHFLPEGYRQEERKTSDRTTFSEWVADYHGRKTVLYGEQPDLKEAHKYGYALLNADDTVTKVIDRTNPNKHWDWWQIGGRWSDMLQLKSGGRADQARKGDIDFAAMRQAKESEAAADYDKFHQIVAGRQIPVWDEVRKRHGDGKIDDARKEYNENPVIVDLRKSDYIFWDGSPQDYLIPREAFIEAAGDRACVTFAVVKDGQWYERGEMCMFAFVHNEMDQAEWNRQFHKMIDSLPDDALLTVVDCHI